MAAPALLYIMYITYLIYMCELGSVPYIKTFNVLPIELWGYLDSFVKHQQAQGLHFCQILLFVTINPLMQEPLAELSLCELWVP